MKRVKSEKYKRDSTDALRREAERLVPHSGFPATDRGDDSSDVLRLVHELQVHQLELEMQNDELQRARGEAEAERTRYSELYEFAPVGYLSLERDGSLRQMNRAGAQMLGNERSRLIGKRIGTMIAAEDQPGFETFLKEAFELRGKQTHTVELHPEGAPATTVELVAEAAEGGLVCRVIATDITWRRKAERERDELQMRLYQAQKLEAIGTLAAGIAHDFNNILMGIQGGLSVLELDLGDIREHHSTILEMTALVERGAAFTKQLLGFARCGKYDVRPLNLLLAVEKASAIFGRARRDITLSIDVAPGLDAVLMDHAQADQVLLNILVNAAQAMPSGGHIVVSAENVELTPEQAVEHDLRPGPFVRLAVTDTGVGMDAATQARVFEPFFTTRGPGEGSGLGLASVYGIVKNHSGFVTVDSELARGTTVTLFLPATNRPIASEAPVVASVQPGKGTILVVDDEAALLDVQARLLRRIGYRVLTASGGHEAIELARQHGKELSLVILDMIMPGMSGLETFDALRALAPELKVLVSSGYSQDGHAQDLLERGCNGFIQKPFSIATLSTKLKELL